MYAPKQTNRATRYSNRRYINSLTIDESDQLEIAAVIHGVDEYDIEDYLPRELDKAIQAVQNLMKRQKEGLDTFHKLRDS